MRKIVDTNFFQCEGIRAYLAKSPQHYAVLTDYAAMEAHKGDTLASIYRSMEIFSQYPKQVIVLKPTGIVCGLSGRQPGLQRRLIEKRQTREFATYCRALFTAKRGDASIQAQVLKHGQVATARMGAMLADAANIPAIIDELASDTYTNNELQIVRKRSTYTEQMISKMLKNITLLGLVARIGRLAARSGGYRRAGPFLTADRHRAIQSQPRSPSSHPEAAAQSDELGSL